MYSPFIMERLLGLSVESWQCYWNSNPRTLNYQLNLFYFVSNGNRSEGNVFFSFHCEVCFKQFVFEVHG